MEERHVASSRMAQGDEELTRCPVCLELVQATTDRCSECDEPFAPMSAPPSTLSPASLSDADASFLALHWRPLVTLGTVMTLIFTGVALRYLAPDRFSTAKVDARAAVAAPTCATPCWPGEACQLGGCVWQKPAGVGHLSDGKELTGPFTLPRDASDALLLDGERFAVARLVGTEVRNARSGEVLARVSEAPQSQRLFRVADAVYATSPQRIYVIDADTTRVLKTIETGSPVAQLSIGGARQRALVSLPAVHAIAVLSTELHAEIDRIEFGDDGVYAVGVDETGTRALTTTGQVPPPGLPDPKGGAAYVFDPSRYASTQDRIRTSLLGNPVGLVTTPDGQTSYVVLRAEDALAPLAWEPSGAVRQLDRIPTCRAPEQIALLRSGRRALVRCGDGQALEVFDLLGGQLVKHVALPGKPADFAVSPDELEAVVALSLEGAGTLAFVDLRTFDVRTVKLGAEPTHVRVAPDGGTALVWSDRAKLAWVVR